MNIVVKKDKRGLKIGSKLLEEIFKIAKQVNAKVITLEVNKKNIPAIKLYQKYGFKQIGLRKKYYNKIDDAFLLGTVLIGENPPFGDRPLKSNDR